MRPALRPLHPDNSLSQAKLHFFDRLSTTQLQSSLVPGQTGCLRTRPDGTILDGHHRVHILRARGIDVDALPREIINKAENWTYMFTELFQIEGPWWGHLAISARPRGGDWLADEMRAWRRSGIDVVVSLLEPEEARDLGLEQEKLQSEANGIEFYSFPIVDRSVPPQDADFLRFLREIDSRLRRGRNVVVHCRQGIGRAGLVASSLLIERGLSTEEGIQRVSEARGVPIPETGEQKLWMELFAAAIAEHPSAAN